MISSKPTDLNMEQSVSATSSQGTLIPFGKYRGRAIEEILVADPQYLEWLTGQDWFRTQHVHLHQVIVNGGAESAETPEHNALQVLFLDDEFCRQIIDVGLGIKRCCIDSRDFEVAGMDIVINNWIGIEIKPAVGDDYPAVLRQMKVARARLANQLARQEPGITPMSIPYVTQRFEKGIRQILFLVSYTGAGATRQQFIRTFEAAGIGVVFQHDVQTSNLKQDQDA